jgi:hypothetical protein
MTITPEHIAQARTINMIDYLRQLGHRPVQSRPGHALYHSPLREDRNPSFSVSFVKGAWVWFDFAREEHGDLIDFLQRYLNLSFKEAIERLVHPGNASVIPRPTTGVPDTTTSDRERIHYTRKLYSSAKVAMTQEREQELRTYFARHRLPYSTHLGAVWLPLGELHLPYIAVPLPTPTVQFIQGLMCRSLRDVPVDRRRLFRGIASPWIFQRNHAPLLVTESIIDCLAGDQLFGPSFTLCALNGLGQAQKLLYYVQRLHSKIVYLALDNDPDEDKGPRVQKALVESLTTHGVHTIEVQVHHRANTKDLHKLLMTKPERISLFELAQTGIHHTARHQTAG